MGKKTRTVMTYPLVRPDTLNLSFDLEATLEELREVLRGTALPRIAGTAMQGREVLQLRIGNLPQLLSRETVVAEVQQILGPHYQRVVVL